MTCRMCGACGDEEHCSPCRCHDPDDSHCNCDACLFEEFGPDEDEEPPECAQCGSTVGISASGGRFWCSRHLRSGRG